MVNVKTCLVLASLFILSSCVSNQKNFFKRKYLNLERIREVEKDAVNSQEWAGNDQLLDDQPVSTDSVGVNAPVVLNDQEKSRFAGIIPELPIDNVNPTKGRRMVRFNTGGLYRLQEKLPALNHQDSLKDETANTDLKGRLIAQSIWFVIGLLFFITAVWFLSSSELVFFWIFGALALIASIVSIIQAIRYFVDSPHPHKGAGPTGGKILNFLMLVGSLVVVGFFGFIAILILVVNFG